MAIDNQFILILVVLCAINVLGSIGDFGFPAVEDENASTQNALNKKPVFLPQQCNENELFYPGDHKDDWVCDCKPGHIYYPKTDRCYMAYRQGPCQSNQYLMIANGQYIPECMPNRCNSDGLVTFKNRCYSLNKAGPCELAELTYVVGVNATTLELECVQENPDISSRFGEDEGDNEQTDSKNEAPCFRGSKRSVQGKC